MSDIVSCFRGLPESPDQGPNVERSKDVKRRRARTLFHVDFADAFLLAHGFDLVAHFIGERDLARNRFEQDERRRSVGSGNVDVFDLEHPVKKRLSCLDVFDPVKLEGVGDFAENTFGDFQALGGEFVDFIFRLEIAGERDEDWHDEPAKEGAQNEDAEVFRLR
jgi:hypothetical protein